MENKQTTIIIEYKALMRNYLDIEGIKYSTLSIDQIGDFIKIYFEKPMSAEEVFNFAIEFRDYQDKCFNL